MSIRRRCAPRVNLMRRRNHLMRKRSELIAHIQNTASQYNLPAFEHRITKKHQRVGLLEHIPDVQVRNSVALDVSVIDHYDVKIIKCEPGENWRHGLPKRRFKIRRRTQLFGSDDWQRPGLQ